MSQINPFTGSILQSPQVQRQQAVEKDRALRRSSEQRKNSALVEDQIDHQVESSEELAPVHEDQTHQRKFKRSRHPKQDESKEDGDEKSRLDLTA